MNTTVEMQDVSTLRHLVIGQGEIGTAIYLVLKDDATVFIRDKEEKPFDNIDVLHICYPYYDGFIFDTAGYIEQYNPKLVIIYSTLPIGTTEMVGKDVVHSPVEGRHPALQESVRLGSRWLGSLSHSALELAVNIWVGKCNTVRTMGDPKWTEWLKLRSTSKYGVNLVWADYESQVGRQLGMHDQIVKDFDNDYNQLYKDLRMPQFQRYILDPPEGEIGGHCVVPNAELLNVQFPNPLLDMIVAMKPKGKKK